MGIYSVIEPTTDLRAVTFIVPGLNIRSQAFLELARYLSACGHRSYILELTGHDGKSTSRKAASAQRWKDDLLYAIESGRSGAPGIPLTIVAYSLGAAVSTCVVGGTHGLDISRMVFLAPALDLLWWTRLCRPLTHDLFLPLLLPSLVPRRYQAASFTTIRWYRALFDLISEASRPEIATTLAHLPTLILLSPRDEFMRPRAIQRWMDERQLQSWKLEQIVPFPIVRFTPHHLIIDPHSLGSDRWNILTNRINEFLLHDNSS